MLRSLWKWDSNWKNFSAKVKFTRDEQNWVICILLLDPESGIKYILTLSFHKWWNVFNCQILKVSFLIIQAEIRWKLNVFNLRTCYSLICLPFLFNTQSQYFKTTCYFLSVCCNQFLSSSRLCLYYTPNNHYVQLV